jgi:hypothetical protein
VDCVFVNPERAECLYLAALTRRPGRS